MRQSSSAVLSSGQRSRRSTATTPAPTASLAATPSYTTAPLAATTPVPTASLAATPSYTTAAVSAAVVKRRDGAPAQNDEGEGGIYIWVLVA